MSRNAEYQFVPTDTSTIEALLVALCEKLTGATIQPGSPDRLLIQWVSNIIVQERVMNNYTGNQNIPSRAEGENLDALGELFLEHIRPAAKAATCQMRFSISEAQESAVLIPAGTRITDASGTLTWETVKDVYVPIGETSVETQARCQIAGTAGNGYSAGQINALVDLYDYYSECTNITESDGGANEATDEEFYELMRASMDGYSCAGARGSYEYFAKQVSTEIADVVANSPTPGVVKLYVLMDDGTIATEEMKKAVLDALTPEQCKNVYLSLYKHYATARAARQTPNTPNVNLFWPLNTALGNIMEETLEGRVARCQACAKIIRQGLTNLGMRLLLSEHMSNTVTSVFLPEGIDAPAFLKEMEARGYIFYIGKGDYAAQNLIQVANMGEIYPQDCENMLRVMEECLRTMGRKQAS